MDTTTIVVIVAVVLLVLLALAIAMWAMRKRSQSRRADLQDRFGPEYDRTVDERGDRRKAERELAHAADQRDKLEIRDLTDQERDRYQRDWADVQAVFVDQPAAATRDADRLVGAVMRDRGYPVDDFETKAHMVAADHPQVVQHYRAAHSVGVRSERASTEELRQAFVHYRGLFGELLGNRADSGSEQRLGSENVDLREHERTQHHPPR